eukprot:TRINITY_DN4202_c0_g1_i1.p2 TRINITY_DN4202_c0_g1~~TRINITY_DN4202_c0_g1_i1.p2  ORF type:complete len:109 (-),score=10.84 TRINITY_DN4202_c0_g1_i1:2309-2635(-)
MVECVLRVFALFAFNLWASNNRPIVVDGWILRTRRNPSPVQLLAPFEIGCARSACGQLRFLPFLTLLRIFLKLFFIRLHEDVVCSFILLEISGEWMERQDVQRFDWMW